MPRWPLAVLFDFDGVIVDSEPVHLRAFQIAAGSEGIHLTTDEYYRELIGYDDAGAWRRVFALHGKPLDALTLRRVMQTKFQQMQQLLARREIAPFEGVTELVVRLQRHNIPMAICSAAIRAEVSAMLRGIDLQDYFAVITCAEDVAVPKPDPSGYLLTLRRLSEMIGQSIAPADAIVIEDAPAVLRSVSSAGFKALGVATSYPRHALTHVTWAVPSLRAEELMANVPQLAYLFNGEA